MTLYHGDADGGSFRGETGTSWTVRELSLCPLGQTRADAVWEIIRKFLSFFPNSQVEVSLKFLLPSLTKQNSGTSFLSFSSVQFSHSVVSDSLQPHELQHARPPCPSQTRRVHSNSCPSSQWCNPAISFSVIPFSSCPQALPASESFPMSQVFAWGSQSIGVSALASVLPMNTQDWSPLEWTGSYIIKMSWKSHILVLPFHGQRSLVGYSPWGHTESDTTEVT